LAGGQAVVDQRKREDADDDGHDGAERPGGEAGERTAQRGHPAMIPGGWLRAG